MTGLGLPARLGIVALAVLGIILACVLGVATRWTPPYAAPEIQAQVWLNTDGKLLRIRDLRGKVVLLQFWRFQCLRCEQTIDLMKHWHRELPSRDGVVVSIHSPSRKNRDEQNLDNLGDYLKARGIVYPVAADDHSRTLTAYGVSGYPTFLVIDRQGRVVETAVGVDLADLGRIERRLERLLAKVR